MWVVHGGLKAPPEQFVPQIGMGLQLLRLFEQRESCFRGIKKLPTFNPIHEPQGKNRREVNLEAKAAVRSRLSKLSGARRGGVAIGL